MRGHSDPPEPLAPMRRSEGDSRNINRRAGVTRFFQVSGDAIEPGISQRARSLFTHHASGLAGADQSGDIWPKMSWVIQTQLPSGR